MLVDGEHVAELGPASSSVRSRRSTGVPVSVSPDRGRVAPTPLSLLVLRMGSSELAADFPAVERVIRAAVDYRLSVR